MTERPHSSPDVPARQSGVSIISAIFLLLLFAALAAYMVSLVGTANITSAQDVQGAQALQAAQAGAEWGLFQLDPNGDNSALPSCFSDSTLAQVPDYTVTVRCTRYPLATTHYDEGGKQIRIYEIVSTAQATGSTPVRIERQVAVRAEKCRDTGITATPYDC